MAIRPNLTERLENLLNALEEVENHLLDDESTDAQKLGRIADAQADAFGIATEIKTMVTGA